MNTLGNIMLLSFLLIGAVSGFSQTEPGRQVTIVKNEIEYTYRFRGDRKSVTLVKLEDSYYFYGNKLTKLPDQFEIPSEIEYDGTKYTVSKLSSTFEPGREGIETKELIIPSSIETIDPNSILGYINFEKVTLKGGSKIFKVKDNILLSADEKKIIRYPVSAKRYPEIPESVIDLNPGAYRCCREALPMPDGMEKVPDELYAGGVALQPLPESLKEIGDYAFFGYKGTNLKIPEGVTKLGDYSFSKGYDISDWYGISGSGFPGWDFSGNLGWLYVPDSVVDFGYASLSPIMSESSSDNRPQTLDDCTVIEMVRPMNIDNFYDAVRISWINSSDNPVKSTLQFVTPTEYTGEFRNLFVEEIKSVLYNNVGVNLNLTGLPEFPAGEIEEGKWTDGRSQMKFLFNNKSKFDKYEILWDTENHNIATIDNDGRLKGLKPGLTAVDAIIRIPDGSNKIDFYFHKRVRITPDRVGVESVYEDSTLPDMIWDLSGRPVYGELKAQQPGIYIVRKNGKTSKRVVHH